MEYISNEGRPSKRKQGEQLKAIRGASESSWKKNKGYSKKSEG